MKNINILDKLKKLNWKKYILVAVLFIIAVLGIYAILAVVVASIKMGGVENVKPEHVFNIGMLIFFVLALGAVVVFYIYNATKLSKSILLHNDLENSRWLTALDIKHSKNFVKTKWNSLGRLKKDGILLHFRDMALKHDADIIMASPIHTLVIGTTGSGKTTGFVDSTIQVLSHCGTKPCMVITDPKGELIRKHKDMLDKLGYDVKVLNLRSPFSSTHWNPFQPAIERIELLQKVKKFGVVFKHGKYSFGDIVKLTYREANDCIDAYVQMLEEDVFTLVQDVVYTVCPITSKDDTTWQSGARDLIFALALAIAEDVMLGIAPPSALCFYNIYKNLTENLENEAERLKTYFSVRLPESKAPAIANTVLVTKDRTLSSYLTEVNRYAQWFNSTSVQAITSYNELDFKTFDETPTALFIEVPDEKDNFHCLATLFVTQMYKELVSKANKNAERHKTKDEELLRNVYFIMDEFGNLPKIDKFDSMITVGRSRKIFFEIVVQDYKQLDNKYGKDVAAIIKSNCNIKIFIGSTEPNTIEEFSKLCGKKKIRSISVSNGKSETANVGVKERPLIYPSELEQLNNKDNQGNSIALCFGYPPLRATMTPSFARKVFKLQEHDFVTSSPKAFDASQVSYNINDTVAAILGVNERGRVTLQPEEQLEQEVTSDITVLNILKNKISALFPFVDENEKDMLLYRYSDFENTCTYASYNTLVNLLLEFKHKAEANESLSYLLELNNIMQFLKEEYKNLLGKRRY